MTSLELSAMLQVFLYVLRLQAATVEAEGCLLGDIHEDSISAQITETGERKFRIVENSGLMLLKGKSAVKLKVLKSHLGCFLQLWGPLNCSKLSAMGAHVWEQMNLSIQRFEHSVHSQWSAPS